MKLMVSAVQRIRRECHFRFVKDPTYPRTQALRHSLTLDDQIMTEDLDRNLLDLAQGDAVDWIQ